MQTLKDRCLELPYTERLNLCSALQDSLIQERRDGRNPHQNRCQILMQLMEEIQGETVPARSKKARWVWARRMVAYQLLLEEFTISETARMMEKDHATIIQMRHRMQDAFYYPYAYKDILDIWKDFQKRLDHDIHEGTDKDIIRLGGTFPDCGQSEMGEASGESRTPGHLGDLHTSDRRQEEVQ